jgi:site-specific DNA-methyltransferase (adenine-specific)
VITAPAPAGRVTIVHGDNLAVLAGLGDASVALCYTDPPFNTGRAQKRTRLRTVGDADGDRRGFGGKRYRSEVLGIQQFADDFDDYLAFLRPRLEQLRRILRDDGSLLLHLDQREVHYVKVELDRMFGRACFLGEIIWAYDYGARTRRRWPAKHDNILWYAKDPRNYCYEYDAIDRIPYMAPGLVGPEKAARGKTPTDVWWQTIVSPTGKEKTGYPTQKPLAIARRIVRVHSRPGELVLDPFAGSGTLAHAAAELGRDAIVIDDSAAAIAIMRARLAKWSVDPQ